MKMTVSVKVAQELSKIQELVKTGEYPRSKEENFLSEEADLAYIRLVCEEAKKELQTNPAIPTLSEEMLDNWMYSIYASHEENEKFAIYSLYTLSYLHKQICTRSKSKESNVFWQAVWGHKLWSTISDMAMKYPAGDREQREMELVQHGFL